MEIIRGIHQIRLPLKNNPLEYINTYLIEGSRGWLLIDTGWNDEDSFEALAENLAEIGLDFGDIEQIITTHIHPDHFGLAGRLKLACGATIAMHEVEKEFIDSATTRFANLMDDMNRWLRLNGVPDEYLPEFQDIPADALNLISPVLPDRGLRDGETISTGRFELQVIWTPGHSPGHICLYEPENRLLFSGDHVLPVTTPNISIHIEEHIDPLDDYLKSLQKISKLDISLGLPAHEGIYTDLSRRIGELLAHHETRKAEILRTITSQPRTAFQISSRITWMEGLINWDEMLPLDRRIAVTEALAHLEALRGESLVRRFEDGALYFYESV